MGLDQIAAVNVANSANPVDPLPERSAAEAYRLCCKALESIGDRQFVLHEILYPLQDGPAFDLRERMLADIPQDGAQTNLLNACLPDDVRVLGNIVAKLIAHFD